MRRPFEDMTVQVKHKEERRNRETRHVQNRSGSRSACGYSILSCSTARQSGNTLEGVDVLSNAQKGHTLQPLYDSLGPFYHGAVDSINFKKSENVRGSEVRILGGGASGMSRDPNDHRTESALSVLVVSFETNRREGSVADLPIFQLIQDLRGDGAPDGVERCVPDSMDSLAGDCLKSPRRAGEWSLAIIRAVEERGRVGRDTMVVCDLLPLRKVVLGDHGVGRGGTERGDRIRRIAKSL